MVGKQCHIFGIVTGCMLVVLGILVFIGFPIIYHNLTEENMVLANEGQGFDFWSKPPFPIYMQIWVWNVTNSKDVMNYGEKPNLIQRGPYTYRETRNKINVTFGSNNDYISYISPQIYEFLPDMSVGDPTKDYITTINIPYLTVVNATSTWSPFKKTVIEGIARLTGTTVYQTFKVSDLIWGYTDPFLKAIALVEPKSVPTTFFGLFADKNNTYDGVYVVDSGKLDSSRTNMIKTFNGSTHLDFWTTNISNMINGTDGTYYPPFLNKDEPIYIFSTDICRSIKSVYEKNLKVAGIPVYRYVGPPSDFENPKVNPDNLGFCTPAHHCLPGGLLNVSRCHQKAPIVMSLPHFLYAEQEVLDMVQGMISPNKEEHQTFFDLEPNTGAPLRINKRLQINVHQLPYKGFVDFRNLKEAFVPVMWLNESSAISDEFASQFRWLTVNLLIAVVVLQWVLIISGLLLAGIMISLMLMSTKSIEMAPINASSEDDEKKPLLLPS